MAPVPHLSRSVEGLVVLVTGAASGMGRATATVFAREGAKVAVTDRRLEDAEAVAAEIRAEGHDATAWALDVSDADFERDSVMVAEDLARLKALLEARG